MGGIQRFGAAAALGTLLAIGAVADSQEPGPIERAGASLDEAGRNLRQGFERGFNRTRDVVRESFEKTRDRVNDMNVEARVYGRIHWDKLLETSPISLTAEAQGIITLRGSVPSEEARKRAVELAADTVGVTRVVDQLAVQSAERGVEVEGGVPASRPRIAPTPTPRPGVER